MNSVNFTKTIIFNVLILFCLISKAQTTIGDSVITSTATFYKSNSPYILNGTIYVRYRANLIIEPGVKILVDKSKKILNAGTISLNGNAKDSIIVVPSNTSNYSNFIIKDTLLGSVSSMSYVNASYFNNLVKAGTVSNSYVHHCQTGIVANTVTNCIVNNCDNGVRSADILNTKISNCNTGINISNSIKLNNSEIVNNKKGITNSISKGSSMSLKIDNTKINNNGLGIDLYTAVGMSSGFFSYFSFTQNEIMGNDTGMVCTGENYYFNENDMIAGTKICNNKTYNFVYPILLKDITIGGVCWCSNDSLEIRKKIYDGHTNNSDLGYVNFPRFQKDCGFITGIEENIKNSESNLILNSINNSLLFKKEINEFEILSSNGSRLNIKLIEPNTYDLNNIKTGLYLIRYKIGEQFYVEKIML